MEGQTGVRLLAALLVAALISAEAKNTASYVEFGGELVLKPKPVSGPITSLTWKFKGDIVAEWVKELIPLEYKPKYQGRTSVETTTGVLTISKMTEADSGLYTVEINNKEQDGGYDATTIKQVPKPQVIVRPVSCDQYSESCTLSCDGDTKGAEPVTFYFKMGDGEWKEEKQDFNIANDKNIQAVPSFSCRMKNPLGEKESDPVDNPFNNPSSSSGTIAGITVGVLLVVAAAVGGVLFYFLKRKPNNGGGYTITASSPESNGSKPEDTQLNDINIETKPEEAQLNDINNGSKPEDTQLNDINNGSPQPE